MNWKSKKLINIIESKFGLKNVSLKEIPMLDMMFQKENACNAITNADLKLTIDELEFVVYEIARTGATDHYFFDERFFVPYYLINELTGEVEGEFLLVFVELNTGYFFTNSSELFLQFEVEVGFLPEDKANQTDTYLAYLASLNSMADLGIAPLI